MRIGILGSGNIGGIAARLFTDAGHEVMLAHASGPESLKDQIAALGLRARAGTIAAAADFGEVVLLAIPWRARETLPAERLRGKIVIDATNPYQPDFSLYDLGDSSSSEEVAKVLPGSRIVKAFNHLRAADLAQRGHPELPFAERIALFLSGDDQDARRTVAGLIGQLGFAPVDAGALREGGRIHQAGGPLYIRVLTGAQAEVLLHGAHAGAAAAPAPASHGGG